MDLLDLYYYSPVITADDNEEFNRAKRKAVYTAMEGMPLAEADGNGGYVAVKQFCPYCGSRHAPGARKCPMCGRELD